MRADLYLQPSPGSCCSSASASSAVRDGLAARFDDRARDQCRRAVVDSARSSTHGGSSVAIATVLAYPLGDLALVAIMVGGLATTGWRLGRAGTLPLSRLPALRDRRHLVRLPGSDRQLQRRRHRLPAGLSLGRRRACNLATVGRGACARSGLERIHLPATFGVVGLLVLVYDHFRSRHLLALASRLCVSQQ
jgi:hypothetical protein